MADIDVTVSQDVSAVDVATADLTTVRRRLSPDLVRRMIVAVVRNDATIRALMGGTASDPRIYPYYSPSAIIDAAHPAYVTYATTTYPEVTTAVGGIIYTLAVWALNTDVMEDVRDRLVALLGDGAHHTLGNGQVVRGDTVGEHDSFQENTKFAGKQLQIRFGYSAV